MKLSIENCYTKETKPEPSQPETLLPRKGHPRPALIEGWRWEDGEGQHGYSLRLFAFCISLAFKAPVCPECHEHNKYGVEEHNGYKVSVACSHPFHRLRKGRK